MLAGLSALDEVPQMQARRSNAWNLFLHLETPSYCSRGAPEGKDRCSVPKACTARDDECSSDMKKCCAKEEEIRHKYRELARKLAKKPNADTGNTNGSDTESARDKQNEVEVVERLEVMSRKEVQKKGP
jgi:hypothetical protein